MSAASQPLSGTPVVPDTVRARYAVTLGAQVFRLLLSVVSATIVPRTLGPVVYGNYSFLLSTATTLRSLLDNSSQQAFFTFSAREPASGSLTKLYGLVLLAQLAVILAFIAVASLTGTTGWLWHAQRTDQIAWVTVLEWTVFLAASLQQLGDSKGLTVNLQLIGASVSLLVIMALVLLWHTARLNFYSFVWLNLAGAALTCLLLGYWLLARNRGIFWDGALKVRAYAQRWWRFAGPILLLQYYLPVVAYLGVYLIQRWYGSQEQAYYGLALQWCTFALVFTNAAVWIFWREIAHQTASGDHAVAAQTYRQFSQTFFFLALVLACWLSASSGLLVQLVAGERYVPAGAVLAIMAFYPVAQTLGQLTTAALKATERTASYARWSIVLSVPDLALSYLLLAPRSAVVPGLHLGAVGLALKTAAFGLASVQVYDLVNCRFLGLSYPRALGRKAAAMATVACIALVTLERGDRWLLQLGLARVSALALSSGAYAGAVLLIVWWSPALVGLTREQVVGAIRVLVRR